MERIALIADIHGNLPALDAVLTDIQRRGIKRIICLGDLVGKGPQPAEAVDRIREVCETTVAGNWDLGIQLPQDKETGLWQQVRLGAERLEYLRTLPFCADLWLSGRRVRLVHASAKSVYHRVYKNADKKERLAMFANTEATGGFAGEPDVTPNVVGYGDIHVSFYQTLKSKDKEGLVLFNTGSVGAPYDGIPQTSYVVLEGNAESREPGPFGVHMLRVPYDMEQAVAIAEQVGLPNVDRFRYEMRTGLEE
jgi:protein phosphatase